MINKEWMHNEFKQLGTDYSNLSEVEAYDKRMGTFRNVDKEIQSTLDLLHPNSNQTLLEIGCGTGAFLIAAQKYYSKCVGLDISEKMIEYTQRKIQKWLNQEPMKTTEKNNIELVNAGFLSYEYPPNSFDHVVSSLALHHLTDFWKLVALRRIYKSMKSNGLLFLRDVIFSFHIDNLELALDAWVNKAKTPAMRKSMNTHIQSEFSTIEELMDIVLKKAGFIIENKNVKDQWMIEYLCRKI